VAATHALYERGLFRPKLLLKAEANGAVETINFQTKCRGTLTAKILRNSDASIMYELNFPSSEPVETVLGTKDRAHLCAGLHISNEDDILFAGKSIDDLFIELTPQSFGRVPTLASGLLDFSHLISISTPRGIIITCGGMGLPSQKSDFVSRFFCPK
jgi:hypothetical protein